MTAASVHLKMLVVCQNGVSVIVTLEFDGFVQGKTLKIDTLV